MRSGTGIARTRASSRAVLGVVTLWMLPAGANHRRTTLLYFLRHSENEVRQIRTNTGSAVPATFVEDCTPTRSCCIQPLSALGLARRDALAEWFVLHGRARTLTHFIATNKPRTVETLKPLAVGTRQEVAECPVDTDGHGGHVTLGQRASDYR